MPVCLSAPDHLDAVAGIRLSAQAAGIRYADRPDLVLIEIAEGSHTAAVFTRNAFCAAPVTLAKQHLSEHQPRFLLINAGNANAGTGAQGEQDAAQCCNVVAQIGGCDSKEILPFSTGVIGERLPMNKITDAMRQLHAGLSDDGWLDAARAIMTTDTLPKGITRTVSVNGHAVTITGIAKGSGMIRPDMATMLAFVATDAALPQTLLDHVLREGINQSFNCITVDGDTSTNDACVLIATGQSGVEIDDAARPDFKAFFVVLNEVMQTLAQAIVRDGEGATKFITVNVEGAQDLSEARDVAYIIAHSPLVKTALFASDPNWGRILAAVGRADIPDLDVGKIDIYLDDVCIVRHGSVDAAYTEVAGQAVMSQSEITIRVALGRGKTDARIWTTDLSYDYVRINADYRS